MKTSALLALLGTVLAIAAPADRLVARAARVPVVVVLTFEDAATDPFSEAFPVNGNNPYDGYKFPGFSEVDVGKLPTDGTLPVNRPGVIPHSGQKYISFGPTNIQELQFGSASIVSSVPDSTINIYAFYYGCSAALQNAETSKPVGCTIAATCVRDGGQSVTEKFSFSVALLQTSAYQVEASPKDLKNCKSVKFAIEGSDAVGLQGLIDDVTISGGK